jgi:hypothetical protein
MGLLHDHPVAYRPDLSRVVGGVTAGVMLSHALCCDEMIQRCYPGNDGWFCKSQQEWEEETGLGRREQETARKLLRGKGVLEEEKRGTPATLHFRINMGNLASLFEDYYRGCSG